MTPIDFVRELASMCLDDEPVVIERCYYGNLQDVIRAARALLSRIEAE